MRSVLLYLLGVPIPFIILIALFTHHCWSNIVEARSDVESKSYPRAWWRAPEFLNHENALQPRTTAQTPRVILLPSRSSTEEASS